MPPRFLPTVLRSNRSLANEKPTGATNHLEGIEVSQGVVFPESPRQQHREGHLIQLNTRPVRPAIDPEILIEPAILALRHREIDKRAQRSAQVADGQQCANRLHQITRPYEIITAGCGITLFVTPVNTERRDHGSGVA